MKPSLEGQKMKDHLRPILFLACWILCVPAASLGVSPEQITKEQARQELIRRGIITDVNNVPFGKDDEVINAPFGKNDEIVNDAPKVKFSIIEPIQNGSEIKDATSEQLIEQIRQNSIRSGSITDVDEARTTEPGLWWNVMKYGLFIVGVLLIAFWISLFVLGYVRLLYHLYRYSLQRAVCDALFMASSLAVFATIAAILWLTKTVFELL
jgi:hypothetical protein